MQYADIPFIPISYLLMKIGIHRTCEKDGFCSYIFQVIGMYVGKATVGVFVIWYAHHSFMGIDLSGDCHSLVTKLPTGINVVPGKISESPFAAGSQQFKFGRHKSGLRYSAPTKTSKQKTE
ncbi:hypothetical protein PVK06_014474 [Gossypium arboreum]|uniref:Uncharacterized protein n=1 Tax=Gossypium arboreum TaxID=29729 RepID=A0ABR0PUP0_GOSAR|nr:hypothetical protein PVK06_014474 [Gossypium arboreum]